MRTLLREKEIYLFDEPTGNLDKEAIREFKKQVTGLRDKIVIIVTHQNDLLEYCDVTYAISTGVVTNE